jgi:hypothetical protein
MKSGVAELAGIVRRDVGRHADGDARGAVREQVGEVGGEDRRLLLAAVVIGAEVDSVLVDAVEEMGRDLGQPRFGVALGRRVIAVDIAEIALPVDERVAHGEVLGETCQRVVDGLVTVGVKIAHRVADDLGAFPELALGAEPELLHGVEQPAMHGLQPVAHIGQRAMHDGRKRISEIALLKRLAEIDGLDRALRIRWRDYALSHEGRLAHRALSLKGAKGCGREAAALASGQEAAESGPHRCRCRWLRSGPA